MESASSRELFIEQDSNIRAAKIMVVDDEADALRRFEARVDVEDDGAAAAGPDHWGGAGTRARVPTRTGTAVRIPGVARPRVSHRARVVAAPASERAPATERETIFFH